MEAEPSADYPGEALGLFSVRRYVSRYLDESDALTHEEFIKEAHKQIAASAEISYEEFVQWVEVGHVLRNDGTKCAVNPWTMQAIPLPGDVVNEAKGN